jgi:hypothetical protein
VNQFSADMSCVKDACVCTASAPLLKSNFWQGWQEMATVPLLSLAHEFDARDLVFCVMTSAGFSRAHLQWQVQGVNCLCSTNASAATVFSFVQSYKADMHQMPVVSFQIGMAATARVQGCCRGCCMRHAGLLAGQTLHTLAESGVTAGSSQPGGHLPAQGRSTRPRLASEMMAAAGLTRSRV